MNIEFLFYDRILILFFIIDSKTPLLLNVIYNKVKEYISEKKSMKKNFKVLSWKYYYKN